MTTTTNPIPRGEGHPREKRGSGGGFRGFWSKIGPGLVTGASDDDPSGIATYSQAGARFGFGLLWTMLFSLPLMTAAQQVSARIGRVTGRGVAGNLRRHYPRWVLWPAIAVVLFANTVNLGADLGAMGDAAALVVGGPALVYAAGFAALCALSQVFAGYRQFERWLKWLTLALLSYVAVVFTVHAPWREALLSTVWPSLQWSGQYWATFVAVLGTTISPYLFFWQAAMEKEEIDCNPAERPLKQDPADAPAQFERIRIDTVLGMTLSNAVGFFIMLSAAATLHAHGVTDIDTSARAAEALRPLAGNLAFALFALGLIGTGLMAVPVLAGSAAYAVGEAMNLPVGMDRKPLQAKGFYGVLTAAIALGLAMNVPAVQHWTHLTPVKALFAAAVVNGVAAAPLMALMMLMASDVRIVGKSCVAPRGLRAMGWLATGVMAAASVILFVTWGR